eukprot:CAMPEP_0198331910 /NCGR_PEP_ID=MMETSP1450-20131203/17915_1 /TAXON_ID=753684 ORGANISM="Madagascaria erythrocladiodes, Strain CCMP3234" /NCGR_SAMPLE_ID=MMETSP1450 /ASSEMBLY_ACC=CAM_ASM_001115 /LENGTH=113 /DNA_ID=CAMNT_0044036329 /DNA_START=46 /DNA_END=384 /DNA_ORIENTATION=+
MSYKLRDAVENGDLAAVERFISGGTDINAVHNNWRPLECAATEGHTKVAKALLAAGADVHATDRDGFTALMLAKNSKVAKVLLKAGANVHATNVKGNTTLMFAKNGEVAKVLL